MPNHTCNMAGQVCHRPEISFFHLCLALKHSAPITLESKLLLCAHLCILQTLEMVPGMARCPRRPWTRSSRPRARSTKWGRSLGGESLLFIPICPSGQTLASTVSIGPDNASGVPNVLFIQMTSSRMAVTLPPACRDFDGEKKSWGWARDPPVSQKMGGSGTSENKVARKKVAIPARPKRLLI